MNDLIKNALIKNLESIKNNTKGGFTQRNTARQAINRIQELEKQLAESTQLHREGLEPFDDAIDDDYCTRVCDCIRKSNELLTPTSKGV